jgi:hypothetical protein
MSHEDLRIRIKQRPFIPFRIVLTEGTSYEIRHPELIMLGKRGAVIGLAKKPDQTFFVVQRNELSRFPQPFFPGPGVAGAGNSIALLSPFRKIDHMPLRLRWGLGGEDDLQ